MTRRSPSGADGQAMSGRQRHLGRLIKLEAALGRRPGGLEVEIAMARERLIDATDAARPAARRDPCRGAQAGCAAWRRNLERCLGRKSGFAQCQTSHEGSTASEGLSEQSVPRLPVLPRLEKRLLASAWQRAERLTSPYIDPDMTA
jgi:hypothetical protein